MSLKGTGPGIDRLHGFVIIQEGKRMASQSEQWGSGFMS